VLRASEGGSRGKGGVVREFLESNGGAKDDVEGAEG